MAVTAIWSVKGSVGKVLRYVANPSKTWNGQYAEAAKFHTVERVLEYDADAMKQRSSFMLPVSIAQTVPPPPPSSSAPPRRHGKSRAALSAFTGISPLKQARSRPTSLMRSASSWQSNCGATAFRLSFPRIRIPARSIITSVSTACRLRTANGITTRKQPTTKCAKYRTIYVRITDCR